MRLSEIRGERVFDLIADIIEPCMSIAEDEGAAALFDRNLPEGMDPKEFAKSKVRNALPKLMKSHRDDLIAIMCAIHGEDRDEYLSGLTMASLIGDVYEILTDEDLLVFFTSAKETE